MKRTMMLLGLMFFICLGQPIRAMAGSPQKTTVEYMAKEFTASDTSEAMRVGQLALLALMDGSGAIRSVDSLVQFQTTMLNGAAVDILIRSGQSEKDALATMARVRKTKDTQITQAHAAWVQIRDQIRDAAGLKPGFDQATATVANAVVISR